VFDFKPEVQGLVVKVALSSVSEDGAIANLDAEVPHFDFDAVHAAATAAWINQLRRMDVTAPRAVQVNLYTAMYHALLSPNLSMDVDGSYRGPDIRFTMPRASTLFRTLACGTRIVRSSR